MLYEAGCPRIVQRPGIYAMVLDSLIYRCFIADDSNVEDSGSDAKDINGEFAYQISDIRLTTLTVEPLFLSHLCYV